MKHSFDLDDLESFLSEEVEQVRMYPDDRVWRNIQSSLHGRDRWPALTFGSILTGSVIVAIFLFIHPNKDLLTLPEGLATGKTPSVQQLRQGKTAPVWAANRKPANELTGETYLPGSGLAYADAALPGQQASHTADLALAQASNSLPMTEANLADGAQTSIGNRANFDEAGSDNGAGYAPSVPLVQAKVIPLFASAAAEHINHNPNLPQTNDLQQIADSHAEVAEKMMDKRFKETSLQHPAPQKMINRLNKSRWAISFYATPSVSYRYLIDENRKVLSNANIPFAPFMSRDVNEFVQQRPKLGLEAGIGLHYLLSDNFLIKTGLQVNYRQFGVAAYTGVYEPAMLQLNEGTRMQSITMYSNLSTETGYRAVELNNNFFQLAIPMGFEMRIGHLKNVDFFTAAAGQFTYQLSGNNYLISSDFKNFVKQPDLNRRFNINMAVEAFAAFKMGGVTLQGGPQIRYQLLPGSNNSYPIREHLVDYGFKIGVLKPLK